MRFSKLVFLLLLFSCGQSPSAITSDTPDQEIEKAPKVTSTLTLPPVAEEVDVIEEEEEKPWIWDRNWPEPQDQRDLKIPATTTSGIALNRVFVTDTLILHPDPDQLVKAIFVALIDFPNSDDQLYNEAVNHALLSAIYDQPKKTGAPKARLQDIARRATKNFKREQEVDVEGVFDPLHFSHTTKVLQNHKDFLTVSLETYEHRGGASGHLSRKDFIFSRETRSAVTLTDLIKPEQIGHFKQLLFENAIENDVQDADGREDFRISSNIRFTPEGLNFHYPAYSPGINSRWQTNLVVPYSKLAELLSDRGKEIMQKLGS